MHSARGKKVLVAMSGGVDSSVAAALLQRQGYDVIGCFMRLGSEEDNVPGPMSNVQCHEGADAGHATRGIGHGTRDTGQHHGCCSLNDAADARLVAAKLGVPFYVLNFRKDFGRIIDYFVAEYNAGRTPNPCVRCNDWLKFGKLADYARSLGADYVATGHYARVEHDAAAAVTDHAGGGEASVGASRLLRGVDHTKDQSYVLFGTRYEDLRHMLLPIGHLHKSQVRRIAREFDLPVFDKPDSQEICFVPDNDYGRLVRQHTPEAVRPGAILDHRGNRVGEHDGQQHFTIGQRRGVGVALGYPIYVVAKNAQANTITLGGKDELLAIGLSASQTNWLDDSAAPMADASDASGRRELRCQVKIRYNSQPVPATARVSGADAMDVRFDEPQSAVTPGQAVVCYDGERVLGGGWIDRAWPAAG